jgi:NTP pyrophosphatase (non-canonical NTP hydrolase)
MNEKLRKIINHYGVDKQLKYFQSEVFELNEAIIKQNNMGFMENAFLGMQHILASILNIESLDPSKEHIKEEIADVMVLLKQFQLYYDISTEEIKSIMKDKIARQLERMAKEVEK